MVAVKDKHSEYTSKDILEYENWLSSISPGRSTSELEFIHRACEVAQQAHEELFGANIEWGADRNTIDLSTDLLERPLPGSVPAVAEASERIAAEYIADFELGTTATQVRRLIARALPSGSASQERIASQLYRSASTLQRQLSAEGTSFRSLLQETRQGLAEQYLKEGRQSQAEIAFMVGFSDQSNFARAFRRWTGMSPGEFRSVA